jgi:hypothetical protein
MARVPSPGTRNAGGHDHHELDGHVGQHVGRHAIYDVIITLIINPIYEVYDIVVIMLPSSHPS